LNKREIRYSAALALSVLLVAASPVRANDNSFDPLSTDDFCMATGTFTEGTATFRYLSYNLAKGRENCYQSSWHDASSFVEDWTYPTHKVGDLASPSSIVPKPRNYTMLLAGLGLIGWVAVRRQRSFLD
jgi:hypothetical protein